MKTRTEIINELIQEMGYSNYLEIGLGTLANFKAIKCDIKHGVDPAFENGIGVYGCTSDEFFETNDGQMKYDLIYLDGLHHRDQLEKDIVNAWNCLNKGGMILIHDIKPRSLEATLVPRIQTEWCGDVFKAWHGFKEKYPKIKTGYIDEKYGLGTVEKSRHKVELGFVSYISFEEYMDKEGWK